MGFSILAVLALPSELLFASSPSEDTEVFIAGGGIAGLSTARALALRGIKAIVAETPGAFPLRLSLARVLHACRRFEVLRLPPWRLFVF